MSSHHRQALERIAANNTTSTPGQGMQPEDFVPVCSIVRPALARQYLQLLHDEEIPVQSQTERLCTRFWVGRTYLQHALALHEQLLAEHPDTARPTIRRDYDACLLLSPVVAVAVLCTFGVRWLPPLTWVAMLVSGVTVLIVAERLNWQYRTRLDMRWSMRDLWWGTALIALCAAAWRYVWLI